MSELDYQKIGFKSGLEIHQQLDSSKLFCNCPSMLRSDEPDFEISRRLHAIAGESGEIDEAVKHEASLDKEFVYQGYDTTCLVEIDEEPPHEINREALKIAVQIALLLNCKIIPVTQIMRKTVIDGSNTSGFQRTVFIARDGYVETSEGKVGIDGVFLEEDAARPVSRDNKKVIYKLDRLGFPLVEIATAPDIKSAEHAKETALKIGGILRSCKVKRGLGTIRQDINISLAGSNRVEIKGFQNPKMMVKTVDLEIERQKKILDSGKKNNSEVRNSLPDGTTEFLRPMPGADRMYPETDLPLLKISRNLINEAKKSLPKLKGEVEEDLKKTGLSEEMIKLLFRQNKIEEFKELLKIVGKPQFVAKVLLIFPKEISKREESKNVDEILEDSYSSILHLVRNGKLEEGDVKEVMLRLVRGEDFATATSFDKVEHADVEEKILKIIKEKPGLSEKAYMGLVMKEFHGKISGKHAMEIIGKYLKQ